MTDDYEVRYIKARLDYDDEDLDLDGLAESVTFKVVIENGEVTDVLDTDFM